MSGIQAAEDAARSRRPAVTPAAHRRVLVLTGVLTAVTLVLTAGIQIYDANLYVMAEATALLAGDRAGRDFFAIGAPLETHLAAAAQLASGGRLIGEFLRQWLYIVTGTVIAFGLGLRLSRSVKATLVMLVPALIILANTPTYHSSKLLFFPLFVWAAWRYLDRPDVRRSAVLGAVSALAFLSRHDYGFYLGFGSCVALAAAPFAVPSSRRLRSVVRDSGAYGVAVLLVLAPWAVSVQMTEGLVEYTQMRVALFDRASRAPYRALLALNPVRALSPQPLPPPAPAVVQFVWRPDIDETRRQELERRFGLRPLEGSDGRDRLRYEVPTAYDVRFLELEPYIRDPHGFPWDRLREARARLPSQANVNEWLLQVALAIPLVLLVAGGWGVWANRQRMDSHADSWHMVVAGAFLVSVNGTLFREPGYVVVSVPLVAALSARFIAAATVTGRVIATGVLVLTMVAAVVWARRAPIFLPSELPAFMASASERLFASPPAAAERRYQYLYECTSAGDRVLITGSTPSLVSYYAGRPMAGGHSYWHHGWLSTPAAEARSLELLERQSVPFAVSTHEAVLDDFKSYPRIREYLEQHYTALEGTNGSILVDTRRQPTGPPFGPLGYPCFK